MKAVDGQKKCLRCHKVLPVSAFNRAYGLADGYQGMCRDCQREERRERTTKNRARNLAKAGTDV
jgi:hypothetical protein